MGKLDCPCFPLEITRRLLSSSRVSDDNLETLSSFSLSYKPEAVEYVCCPISMCRTRSSILLNDLNDAEHPASVHW